MPPKSAHCLPTSEAWVSRHSSLRPCSHLSAPPCAPAHHTTPACLPLTCPAPCSRPACRGTPAAAAGLLLLCDWGGTERSSEASTPRCCCCRRCCCCCGGWCWLHSALEGEQRTRGWPWALHSRRCAWLGQPAPPAPPGRLPRSASCLLPSNARAGC